VFHRALAAATVAGLAGLALSACGDRAQSPAAGRASSPAGAAGFDQILAAAQASQVAWCPLADGEAYVSLPAPPPESAAAASYFRYLEGRIYQFGPCGAGPGQDDELRIFRYAGPATRDAAIREISARNLRPTASFAVGDTFDAEIWSSDPSLEGPVGRAAAAVHGALGRMDGARHLEVDP
jgi:hypothetical protein